MLTLYAYEMNSYVLINTGQSFEKIALPMEAQFSPVYDIAVLDINKDGHMDLIAGGNLYAVKPEIGRYDASNGIVMLGDGKGHFTALSGKNQDSNAKEK